MNQSFKSLLLLLFLHFSFIGVSQEAFWVFYTDKECNEELAYEDRAVTEAYVSEIENQGFKVVGNSKWFNASCVLSKNNELPVGEFIKGIKPLGKYKTATQANPFDTSTYGNSDVQLKMLGLDKFHAKGYTGQGIKLALFDAGFYGIDTFSCFKTIWDENRIAAHYDFVLDRPLNFDQSNHGAYVLSIAGGRCDDSLVGAAPEATFVLARTEDGGTETHLEEYYWVYALEWASEEGVDIIHSSLGYSRFDSLQGDYTYEDMDGETTIITQATQLAISKGIFVTNSAGNEGDKDWHYITAPCDGKNVLCVGAVDSFRNYAKFSSVGPSYDQRVKPEVMAMGKKTSYQHKSGEIRQGNGTSFSGPLIAGMVACLMEANPKAYNNQIFEAIIQSADRYNTPDTLYGYGIPEVNIADSLLKRMVLGVDKLEKEVFNLSPNPGKESFEVHSKIGISQYSIFNAIGEKIVMIQLPYEVNSFTVNSSNLLEGAYYVVLEDNSSAPYAQKWIKY